MDIFGVLPVRTDFPDRKDYDNYYEQIKEPMGLRMLLNMAAVKDSTLTVQQFTDKMSLLVSNCEVLHSHP